MMIRNGNSKLSMVALAVVSMLNALPAYADDAEVQALTQPTNAVELGVTKMPSNSAKFGEYSGLNKAGNNFVGNVSVRGGDAYGDKGGVSRWSIFGNDLGLTSESAGATFSEQGQWKIGFEFDELQHNLSDTYQTPYVGAMGDNRFTLPTGFGAITGSAADLSGAATGMTAARQQAFHNVDISTKRNTSSLNGELTLNSRWSLDFDIKHLDQTGAKLMSIGGAGWGAAGAGAGTTPARAALAATTGEIPAILPMPTRYTTDTFKIGANWKGEQSYVNTALTGSYFRDGYDRLTFDTWFGANMRQTIGTAPDNDSVQLSVAGGYQLAPKTKLAANLSVGRNTQNASYVYDAFMMQPSPGVLAASSANALVETQHFDVKVTDQSIQDWVLSAGVKKDTRDNRTPSNIYSFYSIGGHQTSYPNAPRSWDKTLYEGSGDYRLDKNRNIRLDYTHEDMKRWCDQYAVGGLGAPTAYVAGTNCVVATAQGEDKIGATYRARVSDSLDYRAGYSIAKRLTVSDPLARTPFLAGSGGGPGLNGGDFVGFYPAFDASRTQQIIKANTNWQASDAVSLSVGGKYTADKYDSTYGEQDGNTWSLNLDASYAYSDVGNVSAYLTQQHRQRKMTDAQAAAAASATRILVPNGATWTDTLMDDDITLGVGFKRKALMGGKLEFTADLTYTLATLGYNTTLNYATADSNGKTCSNADYMSCGDLPKIVSEVVQLKLTGTYQIEKKSKLAVGYTFQQLSATDYYYNGYQLGSTPSKLMPDNQQPGSYAVNVISVGYIHEF